MTLWKNLVVRHLPFSWIHVLYQASKFVICLCIPKYSLGKWLFWAERAIGGSVPPFLETEVTEKTMCSVPLGGPLPYENITLVYDSQQLNGTQRVLLDNVLSEEQCRELHSVASVRTWSGRVPDCADLAWARRRLVPVSLGARKASLKCHFLWLWRHFESICVGMFWVLPRPGCTKWA